MYYDKFGPGAMMDIDFGPGTANPKLWGEQQPQEKKKRRWVLVSDLMAEKRIKVSALT